MDITFPQVCKLKTGETVTIRTAVADDAQSLLAHALKVLEEDEFNVTTPQEFDLTEEEERIWIQMHTEDPGKIALMAVISGDVVGLIHFEVGTRKRIAHRGTLAMSVSRAWRSRGLGTLLLQALIDWAEADPVIEKLGLAVLATNIRAIGLYRKLGFIEEGRRPREVKIGPKHYVDDILMYRLCK